jgi:hypothetical protein
MCTTRNWPKRWRKESGGDQEYAALPEQHRFQIPEDAHWKATRTKVKNVGKAIQDALRAIETANPAFVEGDRLMQFDVVLANPPYSIKQWDRNAWSADPWGRNIYGTPPQDRADEVLYRLRTIPLSVQSEGLVRANELFAGSLRGEKSMPFGERGEHTPVRLIDFENLSNNDYVVTNQWVYPVKEGGRRFDIVMLVKGYPKKGLIWHFQGSGKSLLMVFAAQKLRMHRKLGNPTVMIVVDRIDLDTQITSTFNAADIPNMIGAATRQELQSLLAADTRKIIITTIHKFGEADGRLNERSNIIVMVDEAHRTQEGDLGRKMRDALPNAFLFGLTGTPINKRDHNTFWAFGADEDEQGYMSRYSFQDSIRDKATLPLHFEAVDVKLQAICRTSRVYPGKTHGLIVDYLGIFDDVATNLDFDEKAVQKVSTNLDELKKELPGVVAKCLAFFPGVDRTVGGYEGLIAAQDCLPDNETRDKFAAEYSVLSRLWEGLSPDPCLGPYEKDYKWLTQGNRLDPPYKLGEIIQQ